MKANKDFYLSKLDKGELWLQYCLNCQQFIFYPRSICPGCLEPDWEWQKLSGKGCLYSYTTVHVSSLSEFAGEVPYIYAIVELKEGISIPANIVNCLISNLQIGLPLELIIIKKDNRPIPAFQPAAV